MFWAIDSEREGQFMCSSFVEKLYEAAYMPERVNLIPLQTWAPRKFTNISAPY